MTQFHDVFDIYVGFIHYITSQVLCVLQWWKKEARKQLSATLKYISVAAREQRCKSGNLGGGGQDRDAEESENGAGSDGSWDTKTDTRDTQVEE